MDGQVLDTILQLSVLVFVVSSMLAMGFNLTIPQLVTPLRNVRLVVLALAVNFVAVPLLAWVIQAALSLDESLSIGLFLIATAAGAPFLPKLAQVAKGNVAFSVGLMVLLMVVTVAYMPLVLPLFLSGVEIDPWDIASSLIFLMLLPLTIGLFVRARYPGTAGTLYPHASHASTFAIALLMVAGILTSWEDVVDLVGTGGFVAIALFLLIALALGYLAGGSDPGTRSVLGLGTAQRNLAAALVVAAQNFSDDPDVLVMIIVAGLVGLVLLMLIGGELGRRSQTATTP